MQEVAKALLTAPIATLFILFGMVFLLIAVVGNISGKIEPGNKARIVSGVFGVLFVCLGFTLYVFQKTPGAHESPAVSPLQTKSGQTGTVSQEPTSTVRTSKQEAAPNSQPAEKKAVVNASIQTMSRGVVANIAQFKKSGELVMLELVAQNSSSQASSACFSPARMHLIDMVTGESWTSRDYTGQPCTTLESNRSSRTWMKFDISEPEKRTFSLSSPWFKGSVDNLVLADYS